MLTDISDRIIRYERSFKSDQMKFTKTDLEFKLFANLDSYKKKLRIIVAGVRATVE